MTEKRFTAHKTIGMFHCFYVNDNLTDKVVIDQILHKYEADRLCDLLNSLAEDNKMLNRMIDKRDGWNNLAHEQLFKLGKENEQLKVANGEMEDYLARLEEENNQLKQFPVKLENRIQKLQEDLQKLTEMDKTDLNPQAVEDIATVIEISLNALLEFKKEILNE